VEKIMRERPVSVTIFGILNIGFGSLGLGWMLLSKMFEGFDASSPGSPLGSYFASMMALWNAISTDPAFVVWNRISASLDVAASLALVAAGIGLLLLKNWSRRLSTGWAIYTIISVFLNLAVLFVVLHRALANALAAGTGASTALVIAAAALGAVLTLVYPALLIFFLTRPRVVLAFQREPGSPL
jgi:hypothetical protein